MAKLYQVRNDFGGGLQTLADPRDINVNELSVAKNISVDKKGRIRTSGSLVSHGEVPTQSAIPAPGSGLFVYSSDHWLEASPTVIDLLVADNAASDVGGEVNAVGSWTKVGDGSVASVGDTDGSSIASNGTSYILKVVTSSQNTYLEQSLTTVIGQRYTVHADTYSISTGSNFTLIRIVENSSGLPIIDSPVNTEASWTVVDIEFVATETTTKIRLFTTGSGVETGYFDDIYITEVANTDILGDWLALSDIANAQADLYDDNSDSFSAGAVDFGTVSTYTAIIDEINFPTTTTITDASSAFLNNNMVAGQIWKISGSANNNILIV